MMPINFNDNAILNILGVDYTCTINGIDKSEVRNILQNAYLAKKKKKRNNIKIKKIKKVYYYI